VPLRDLDLSDEEVRMTRGYQFLSAKPLLIVANVGENAIGQSIDLPYNHKRSAIVALSGKVEAELAQLSDEDARAFMDDLGIAEPARDRVIKTSYDLLGLISFLTAGPDEVRAWPILRGTPAVEAAGTIHSDIQRGFIRAQIIAFDDLVKAGSEAEGRKNGTLRMEGKQYLMHDGDVCHFMFNV
jgi:ribosome-binding ATPase